MAKPLFRLSKNNPSQQIKFAQAKDLNSFASEEDLLADNNSYKNPFGPVVAFLTSPTTQGALLAQKVRDHLVAKVERLKNTARQSRILEGLVSSEIIQNIAKAIVNAFEAQKKLTSIAEAPVVAAASIASASTSFTMSADQNSYNSTPFATGGYTSSIINTAVNFNALGSDFAVTLDSLNYYDAAYGYGAFTSEFGSATRRFGSAAVIGAASCMGSFNYTLPAAPQVQSAYTLVPAAPTPNSISFASTIHDSADAPSARAAFGGSDNVLHLTPAATQRPLTAPSLAEFEQVAGLFDPFADLKEPAPPHPTKAFAPSAPAPAWASAA